ncbi:hypothetical protein [Vibrio cholerae]|uniref:hypothetical protein n=1 Tax=Vibrio cholerae TaxID=666 RepID=UPI0011DA9DF7|nr:hypothetical protein [Vibrio cholerae]TXX73500.1 hypothetical protein FXE98_03650 [Vibrio cholerae]GIA74586.1 hypothetical protein VCSRO40_0946 [Vibrio cholerae]
MQLQVGKTYQVSIPAEKGLVNGEVICFKDRSFTFTVLPKPKMAHREQLTSPEWYWVKQNNGVEFWFKKRHGKIKNVKITEITKTE